MDDRKLCPVLLIFILFLITLPAFAADQKALVGGRLIDGFGHRPLANSVILIDGDTIKAVGTVETLEVPPGYEVISTEGMDVLPGLWESHAHLMINGHADYPHWNRTYIDRFAGEIMPASAVQLLLAGVTSARDLGAPLEASAEVKRRIAEGEIPGPRLFTSGPFLQHEVEAWEASYRWAVKGADDARAKVRRLAEAGMEIVKLIDQDKMTLEESRAIVEEAHAHGMKVVAHAHRPDEIRRGLAIGVDNFEHTGLTTAPEYPEDVIRLLRERTATGRIAGGPLFWTPTVEGLWRYDRTVDNPEPLDDPCWHRGLADDNHRRYPAVDPPSGPARLHPAHPAPQADPAAQDRPAARVRRRLPDRHRQRHPDEIPLPIDLERAGGVGRRHGHSGDGGDPRRHLLAGGDDGCRRPLGHGL